MFDPNDKKPFHHGVGGLFPPEKPRFTLSEDMLHMMNEMRNTIDRMMKFERRVEDEVHDLMSKLTSDNVLFKDTFSAAYNLFTQEIKNEVNLFESNLDNTIKLFVDNLKSDYDGLAEEVQNQHVENLKEYEKKLKEYEAEITAEYDTFKQKIEAEIENGNNANAEASADFQRKLTTELNMFTADMNQKFKNFTDTVSVANETFKNTWSEIVEDRLDAQDNKLESAYVYMKTNLEATVRTELGDMYDSGDFASILEGEVFNDIQEKMVGLDADLRIEMNNNTAEVETMIDECEDKMDELESRMENIVGDGTATEGNTELLDIRVGADGKTYDTAGESVRTQIKNLSTAHTTETVEGGAFGDGAGFLYGAFIHYQTGEISPLDTMFTTSFIPIGVGDSVTALVNPRSIFAVYDENLNYLYGYQASDDEDGTTQTYTITDPRAKYIRLSRHARTHTVTINRVSGYTNEIERFDLTRDTTEYIDGRFIHHGNGKAKASTGFACTDFIDCSDIVRIEAYYYTSNTIGAFYDENLNYISGMKLSDKEATDVCLAEAFTVPENAKYVRFTFESESHSKANTQIVYFKKKSKEEVKPLAGKKYVSVGDSITWYDRNSFTANTTSTYSGFECIGYQSYICLKLGCEHENCGYSGKTSAYMREQVLAKDFTDVDIVSIMTGMNDWGTSMDVETYKQNLRDMIDHILTNNPVCKVVMLSPTYGWYTSSSLGHSPRTYTEAMKEVALEYGLPFFDNMANNGINKHNYASFMCDDTSKVNYLIHPNLEAYNIIGNQITEFFKQHVI